jgi:hypothetical protein
VVCQQCKETFTFHGDRWPATPTDNPPPLHPVLAATLSTENAENSQSRQQLASLGELFSRSWNVFKRRILTLFGINLLGVILAAISYFLLGSGLDQLQGLFGNGPVVMVLAALVMVGFSLLVVTAIGAGMTYAVVDEELGVRQALGYGIQNFRSFLWVFLLLGFILFGGYLAFFVVGLLLTVWFIFAQFVLAREDVRGMDALLKSRAYVRGHGWGVCGRLLLLSVLGTVVSVIPFIGLLFALVLGPLTLIYYHEIYRDLREIKGSVSYPSSRGEKGKWLLAGLAGYLVVPVLGLLVLGPALFQGLGLFGDQILVVDSPPPVTRYQSPAELVRPETAQPLAAPPVTQKPEPVGRGSMVLSQTEFAGGESVTVRFSAPEGLPDNAWVGIVPGTVPHGDESRNDQHDVAYEYLNGRTSGTLAFIVPAEPGIYDLRMHDTDDAGREIASESFRVGGLADVEVSARPEIQSDSNFTLELDSTSVGAGDQLVLRFSGIQQPALQDWIALFAIDAGNQDYGEYQFLTRQSSGELYFTAPDEPGQYEFRLFLDWPDGGYNAAARSLPITVGDAFAPLVDDGEETVFTEVVEPEATTTTVTVPLSGDDLEQVMVYIYSINYLGSVTFNGEDFYAIEGERDMNYNYSGYATLQEGSNRFVLDYQALQDPWMTKLQLKVSRYDWQSSEETVFGEWTFEDPAGTRTVEVILGN